MSTSVHPDLVIDPPAADWPAIRRVSPECGATWLGRGFADFRARPAIGLAYGGTFAAIGWLLTFGLEAAGMGSLILPLAGGFLLVAPIAAAGLYEVSRRIERGEAVSLAASIRAVWRNAQVADMGMALLLVFLVWVQLAMVIFALFFGSRPPALGEFGADLLAAPQAAAFLLAGGAVGAVLAALAFSLSVVAMPMVMDRPVSAMTAMRTSLRVVWVNRLEMVGWAATLAFLGFAGISLVFVGLALTLPIAAHASWHAYRDLVEPA